MKDLVNELVAWIKNIEPLVKGNRELEKNLGEISRYIKTSIRGNLEIQGDQSSINIGPQTKVYIGLRGNEEKDKLIEGYQKALAQNVKQLPWALIDPGFVRELGGRRSVLMNQVYVSMSAHSRIRGQDRETQDGALESRPLQEVFEQPEHRLMVLKGPAPIRYSRAGAIRRNPAGRVPP